MAPEERQPALGSFIVTLLLLGLAAGGLVRSTNDALAGAIIGGVIGYWLPTRPNRQPPS
jgi:hypothetical protein